MIGPEQSVIENLWYLSLSLAPHIIQYNFGILQSLVPNRLVGDDGLLLCDNGDGLRDIQFESTSGVVGVEGGVEEVAYRHGQFSGTI